MMESSHLSDDKIGLLLDHEDREIPGDLAEHLSTCTHCQQRVELLAAEWEAWNVAKFCLAQADQNNDDFSITSSLEKFGWKRGCDESMARQLLDAPIYPEMLGRLGRYEVERVIGSGGMGIVFRAHDSELHRPVAIKILAPHLSGSGSARSRFAREARAAAAIVNDHVVPIHSVESGHARPYLVMQYIAGDSLQARIDREGTLELNEILRIGMQVAKGLAAAHAQGLIHRDVKPSNILLDENVSRALLTDFGLARTQDDACLTRSGFHPGTPHYMSPEQVRGEDLDGRSDLFGLGCVLYALCTGHPPFRAESGYAVMRRITDETPRSISEQNPAIPAWLERVVLRLLEKDKAKRFQFAMEVAELLEQCLAHVQKPNQTPLPESIGELSYINSSGRGGMRKWLAGGLASFFALFAGVLIVLETSKGTLKIKSEADNIPVRIKQSDRIVEELTVSKSGKSIRLAAGEYTVELEYDSEELLVTSNRVFLARGETKPIEIQFRKSESDERREKSSSNLPVADSKSLIERLEFDVESLQRAFDNKRLLHERGLASTFELLFADRNLIHSQVTLLRHLEANGLSDKELQVAVSARVLEHVQRLESVNADPDMLYERGTDTKELVALTRRLLDEAKWIQVRLSEIEVAPATSHEILNEISDPVSTTLARAIEQFNQIHSAQLHAANTPSVTEEEVCASLSWHANYMDLLPETRDAILKIVITRKLPTGWSFQLNNVTWDEDKRWRNAPATSVAVEINLMREDQVAATIRKQFTTSGLASVSRPGSPLVNAIAEFNTHKIGDQPLLTIDETLAALSMLWRDIRWQEGTKLSKTAVSRLMQVADTHAMDGVTIQALVVKDQVGDHQFLEWSIAFVLNSEDGTSGGHFVVRKRFRTFEVKNPPGSASTKTAKVGSEDSPRPKLRVDDKLLSAVEQYFVKLDGVSAAHPEVVKLRQEIESLQEWCTVSPWTASERLKQVVTEVEGLKKQLGSDHPRVRYLENRRHVLELLSQGDVDVILHQIFNPIAR